MELYIAGGCGEHGRNCFYLEAGEDAWLVDCGVMAGTGALEKWPALGKWQIQKLRAVFLTHSHADHTGAIPWLIDRGYEGPIVATAPTFSQLPFECHQAMALEEICTRNKKGSIGKLQLCWGLSGHCEGSVWLHFFQDHKSILFSGDYTEASRVYPCDKLRDRHADLGVIDCAYGHDRQTDAECTDNMIETVRNLSEERKLIFLPVPKYGRGLDLLLLLYEKMPEMKFYGDGHFLRQLQLACGGGEWYENIPKEAARSLQKYRGERKRIVFLSDPQLRGKAGERARVLLEMGARGVMTGTPETGSFSEELLKMGYMTFARYPVHLNEMLCEKILQKNNIERAVCYHSPEFGYESPIKI